MLIPAETLLVFVPAALALNLTPGNDMLFCLGQGMKSGPRAGIAASLGIATGVFLHCCAAGIGLAALLAAYPAAFEVLRWAGVVYLVYLAVQALRGSGDLAAARAAPTRASAVKAWRAAVLVSLLNPKVAVFVLAFLPQFVDVSRGSAFVQFMLLGLILNIGGTVVNAVVGAFAGRIGRWLGNRPSRFRVVEVLTGILLLAIAARIALERRV
ncbi:threonine/homoserine/homoserine lactone efflux protein [Ancylobacter aquaticus]|uniref:Threonine/homoserine/homoserine lactone efflux protein n=1 Tax=Ancylobacter aquaticus TaxID=100 RepID=A0A4R1I995_ANCAQ|nr:LysE family translocator [Ancylobacter aquaticus]TCK31688.1 threonine/homoserine/homoserine lactone efflux protein [Ancylobacter aquaticus]